MPTVIRDNLILSSDTVFTDSVQIAATGSVTVLPGVTLNMSGKEILVFGKLDLQGSAEKFAVLRSASVSTENTSGLFKSNYGLIEDTTTSSFFSNGTLQFEHTVFNGGRLESFQTSTITDSLIRDTVFDIGIENTTVSRSTLLRTPLEVGAFDRSVGAQQQFNQVNFVGKGQLIFLDPFFNGSEDVHFITISSGFISTPDGESFETHVYDRDDDLRVKKDLTQSMFTTEPYTNATKAFKVGTVTVSSTELRGIEKSVFQGGEANDRFSDGSRPETFKGGGGIDTVKFAGPKADYTVEKDTSSGLLRVNQNAVEDNANELSAVERLSFSDINLAFDTQSNNSAGGIYRLYEATFNRQPDLGGLGFWINEADKGLDGNLMAEKFVFSEEFKNLYQIRLTDKYLTGNDIRSVVSKIYMNVLDRTADEGGLAFYSNAITTQQRSVGQVLAEISDSPENRANLVGIVETGVQYTPFV